MGSTYRLILQSGPAMGTEYPLEKTELFLGRDVNNDLVVNDPEVSRRHARLVQDGVTYRIEDLGSTNGTFIRGQRLSAPVLLRPGEIITFGEKVVLRYEVTSSDTNATVAVQRTAGQNMPPSSGAAIPRVQVPPPAVPSYGQAYQPVQAAPPPAQAYQGIPAAPAVPMMNANYPMPPAQPRKKSRVLVILLILAGIIVLFCVLPLIIIDATRSYCSLFPGITNFITSNFFNGAIGCP